MAGTQEGPNHKDSRVSSSHRARRPSEPGIASPRGSLLSTRGGRNAPGSPRPSVSAGLGQSLSPNAASGERSRAHAFLSMSGGQALCAMLPTNSLGSTCMRQQQPPWSLACLVRSVQVSLVQLQAPCAAPGGASSVTSRAQQSLLQATRVPRSRRMQDGAICGSLCRRGQVRVCHQAGAAVMGWHSAQWPQPEALHLQVPGVQLAACRCCCHEMAVVAVAAVDNAGNRSALGVHVCLEAMWHQNVPWAGWCSLRQSMLQG